MSEPTLAEVADKAVDHVASGVAQIASTVEKLAPGAWEAAVRKQQIEGAVDLAIGVVVLAVALTVFRYLWRTSEEHADRMPIRSVSSVALVCVATLMLCMARSGAIQLLNPQFYAAVEIATVVKR